MNINVTFHISLQHRNANQRFIVTVLWYHHLQYLYHEPHEISRQTSQKLLKYTSLD